MEEINSGAIEKVSSEILSRFIGVLDLFVPSLHNKLMKKRIENAVKTVELIKANLLKYKLTVDYEKYFEQKLQVPLMSIEAFSEVETDDQRTLLQNLFTRHLLGEYDDDGYYPSYVNIIKELTSEDIQILMSIKNGKQKDYPAKNIRHLFRLGLIDIYHEITVPKTDEGAPTEIDGGTSATELENITWGTLLGEQRAVQAGAPYITEYGMSFLEASASPLAES